MRWLPATFAGLAALIGSVALALSLLGPTSLTRPSAAEPNRPIRLSEIGSSPAPPIPTFPPVLLAAAGAMATFYAPTAIPTNTPIPTPEPQPTPPFYCPSNPDTLPLGTICEGPPAQPPTPLPWPRCETPPEPMLTCEVRAASPTPTPVRDRWPVMP